MWGRTTAVVSWLTAGLAGVAAGFGCGPIEYSCGGDEDCVSGEAGRCEVTGYCSYVDGTCPAGRRYSAFAGSGVSGQCLGDAPADVSAGAVSDGAASTTGDSGSVPDPTVDPEAQTSGTSDGVDPYDPTDTDPTDASGATSPTGGSDSTTGGSGPTSVTDGGSSGGGPDGGGDCIDYDAASDLGLILQESTVGRENDWDASCGDPGDEGDFVVVWIAPENGHYHFDAVSENGHDPVLVIIDGCGGDEVACNDDRDESTMDSKLEFDLAAGDRLLFVLDGSGSEGDFSFTIELL